MNRKHDTRGGRRGPTAWWLGALVVMATALLAGCGGSSGGSSADESRAASSAQAGGPGGFAEISEETRSCLKEKGLELPDPGEGGPPSGEPPQGLGEGGAKMKEALEECGVELPKGGPEGTPPNPGAFRTSIKEYATCMNENGYELPEPNLSGEGPVFKESEVDREDPKFEAAAKKCQSLLGGPGGTP